MPSLRLHESGLDTNSVTYEIFLIKTLRCRLKLSESYWDLSIWNLYSAEKIMMVAESSMVTHSNHAMWRIQKLEPSHFWMMNARVRIGIIGGGSRIRTHGARKRPTVFKTAAFGRSAIPPFYSAWSV
jgi:hypothetical protein